MTKGKGVASDEARATAAEPVPVSALRDGVPNAGEDIATHLARVIALHGFGTINGADRQIPPTDEWALSEWQQRILDVIPGAAEARCRALADDILEAIFSRSNDRQIDDGIRTVPKFAAEQIRRFSPGMVGLILNLERLSDTLDAIAASEVLAAQTTN